MFKWVLHFWQMFIESSNHILRCALVYFRVKLLWHWAELCFVLCWRESSIRSGRWRLEFISQRFLEFKLSFLTERSFKCMQVDTVNLYAKDVTKSIIYSFDFHYFVHWIGRVPASRSGGFECVTIVSNELKFIRRFNILSPSTISTRT